VIEQVGSGTGKSAGDAPRRGRPRSEKATAAILDAAVQLLLAGGVESASMDAIAERAGVSKATIYRWWPTKETLAVDALFHAWAGDDLPAADLGSLRDDLLALFLPWIQRLNSRPYARVIGALITKARSDSDFAEEYDRRLVQPRRDQARPIFARAIERGEIAAGTDVDVVLDLLYGAFYHRLLHGHLPLDDAFVSKVVEMTLGGVLTRG
jgi:AcrR family transcriptional regulator